MDHPSAIGPAEIVEIASKRTFGSRLITNINRGLIVEAIISTVLCPEWVWCSEDYYRCDFKHPEGAQLEVKQSAACQSWETKAASVARWDIGSRKGFWEGEKYIAQPGRNAEIYILAWHPIPERDKADHRDPAQWEFYVVLANLFRPTKTIGLAGAKMLTTPVSVQGLAGRVSESLGSIANSN